VRGNDLLSSAIRQAWLARQLGFTAPEYAHLPLAVGPHGERLAKRDGAISLAKLHDLGWTPAQVVAWLARSLGLVCADSASADDLVNQFRWDRVPRQPWIVTVDRPNSA